MPKPTETAPGTALIIQGETFSIENQYEEGHTISAAEAAALNEVKRRKISIGFGAKVKAARKAGDSVPSQADLDKYVEGFKFGVRKVGLRIVDPIMQIMRGLAEGIVKKALIDDGTKIRDITRTYMNEYIDGLLAKPEPEARLRAIATKQHEEMAKIDFSDLS